MLKTNIMAMLVIRNKNIRFMVLPVFCIGDFVKYGIEGVFSRFNSLFSNNFKCHCFDAAYTYKYPY